MNAAASWSKTRSAQADLAMHADLGKTGHVVGKVSQPSAQASQVR